MSDATKQSWVFRSGWPCTIVIKPTRRKVVSDEHGNETIHTERPIKLRFESCFLSVNENMAKQYGVPAKTLAEWLKMEQGFGRRFHLVDSPEIPKEKKDAKILEQVTASKKGVSVNHGTRKV